MTSPGEPDPGRPAPGEPAPGEPSLRPRRLRRALLGAAGGVVGLAAVLFGVDAAVGAGELPRGTSIGGVDVGGLSPEDAGDRLRARVDARAARPLPVRAGDVTAAVTPAEAGLGIDVGASVAAADSSALNPWTRLSSLFTTREVAPVQRVDGARLDAAVEQLRAQIDRPVTEGAVTFEEARAVPVFPRPGLRLDTAGAARTLAEGWAGVPEGGELELPAAVEAPSVPADAVQRMLDGFAARAVAGPVTVRGATAAGDPATAVLPPERIGEIVRIEADGGGLVPRFDAEAAGRLFGEQLAGTVAEARDASVRLGAGGPEVVGSADGRRIDWEATLRDWAALFEDDRAVDAVYVDEPAAFTTADAEGLGVTEVIGEFTTGGFSYASGVNIRRVAQEVDGALVRPGETFSLNGHTGPRGTAQGYVESGIILDGHADQAVGGGISQFATTLFNAAYFAGMQDAGHQEHSYYISRYPAGREATVYEGAIDLKFTNPTSTGVLIEAFGDADSVTVRLWGTKTVDVESVNGGRWNPTEPQRITLTGADCAPSSGAPGFTTSDTRIIRDAASGAEVSRSTETTVYDPSPIVTCR